MSDESLAHRIRVSLGKAFHHKHTTNEGTVDVEHIANEHGVSEDQVMEQFAWLREQNMVAGPLENEARQIGGVPGANIHDHNITEDGLLWAASGYPAAL